MNRQTKKSCPRVSAVSDYDNGPAFNALPAMLTCLLLTLAADPMPIEPAKLTRTNSVDYSTEIVPILRAKCTVCHAGKITEGDYDVSSLASTIKGGKKGPAIVPGKPAESNLYLFSSHRKKPIMPPKTEENPLTPVEVALIERWIKEGAKGPAEEVAPKRSAVSLSIPAKTVVPVRAAAVAANRSFAAASRANLVSLYDPKTGVVKKTLIDLTLTSADGKPVSATHVSLVEAMAVSPNGKQLVTGSFREITIWDVESGKPIVRVKDFAHIVVALAYSPDGKTLAVAGGVPTEDGEVKFINAETGKITGELKRPHSDTVFGIAFSPDGKRLATASADKFVKLWDFPSGTAVKSFEGHTQHVLDVAWTPDGKRLVSAGADALLKVWDVEKGEKVRDIPGFGKQATRLAALTSSSTVLAATGDGAVKRINTETGGTDRTFPSGTGFVFAVAGSPDGDIVIAGGEDGVVRLFDGKTGKAIKEVAK